MKDLAQETDEVRQSEAFRTYLDVMSKFHSYSFHNQLLILIQNPEATKVMGYRQWNQLNRYVKKGEHGIKILAPMLRKQRREKTQPQQPPEGEELEVKVLSGFMPVTVFDVQQTDGEPMPHLETLLSGADYGHLEAALQNYCAEKGIEVKYERLAKDVYGESRGGQVAVDESIELNAKAGVLVHEVAHEMLHKTEEGRQLPRALKELHAEAVSYVVCRHFGLRPKSSNYLALYRANSERILQNMSIISDTSKELIKYLEPRLSGKPAEKGVHDVGQGETDG